ncbi:MAG: hypothetical protein QM770_11005 [Tepidisphaeraceae bacterium]
MISNWIDSLSNTLHQSIQMSHLLTVIGMLVALVFGVLYITKRKPDFGLLMVVALLYAITPLVPYALYTWR